MESTKLRGREKEGSIKGKTRGGNKRHRSGGEEARGEERTGWGEGTLM